MTFEELDNARFLLKVSAEGFEDLSFELNVTSVKGNTIIALPITVDGKEVTFESNKISTEIWAVSEDKPPYTAKARCGFEKLSGTLYLIVMAITAPIKQNKRAAYRVGLYLPCNIQLGLSSPVLGEIVNGSDNGFAVRVYGDSEIKPLKDVLVVTFSDKDMDDRSLSLTGLCVRKEDKEDSSIYGCRILETGGGFKSYLVKKQSKRCRN